MLVVNNISKGGLLESSSLIPEKPGDLESLYQTTLLHGLSSASPALFANAI